MAAEDAQNTDRLTPPEQDRIREVLGAIRQQVEQLQKEGKRDAAERLLQVVETMNRKFASDVDAHNQDRREAIQKKLRAVKEHAEKLAKEGKGEQAEKLMREAEGMARTYKEELDRRNVDRSPSLEEKLSRIREQAQKLAKEGKGEQAEKLMREVEAMTRAYKEELDRPNVDRSQGAATDLNALVRQLVERGRKEGNPEAAERVRQRAEALARELKELDRPERELGTRRERLVEELRATRGHREGMDRVTREAEPLTRDLAERNCAATGWSIGTLATEAERKLRDKADQSSQRGQTGRGPKADARSEATARSLNDRTDAPCLRIGR